MTVGEQEFHPSRASRLHRGLAHKPEFVVNVKGDRQETLMVNYSDINEITTRRSRSPSSCDGGLDSSEALFHDRCQPVQQDRRGRLKGRQLAG